MFGCPYIVVVVINKHLNWCAVTVNETGRNLVFDVKFLQIIMAKAAGGPKTPKAPGHWDKDDWKDGPEQQHSVRFGVKPHVDKSRHLHEYFA